VSDEVVRVKGWVKSVRAHKNVSFAAIADGSTSEVLQAVFKGQNISEQ
jgi:asparaginyl-tRNA synthetase